MDDVAQHDNWTSGESYDAYIGRWSRRIAPLFVEWLNAADNLVWADVGCGTGALSQAIVDVRDPAAVIGIEPSDTFREHARAAITDPCMDFRDGDASSLPLDDQSCDIVVSALVLNFVPDPYKALSEMKRITVTGGSVAFYVWDYCGGGLELLSTFWSAASSLNPEAKDFTEKNRFHWCNQEDLARLASDCGLQNVNVESIETDSVFRDFPDYWQPFTLGTGPAPGYYKSLSTTDRDALRGRLYNTVSRNPDGSIPMKARVLAVCGRV